MNLKRNEGGFSLIELVIVIVILGILAAVAIPKYEDMRENARVATLKGELGGIRATLSIQYAKSALTGTPTWPALTGSIFADGVIPKDPVKNSNAVKTSGAVDNAGGWLYNASTGVVQANLTGYSSY